MYYFFYKTTNLVNDKVYYGVHKTRNLDDGYLGSGVAITAAIKKYGKQNFHREILVHFFDRKSMYVYEKEFITEDIVNDENTYNQTVGGFGGFSHINNYGENNPMKNPEVARRCIESTRKSGGYATEKRLAANKQNSKKGVDKIKGVPRPEHSEFMREWSKQNWEKNKEEYRDLLNSTFDVISPDGVKYTTNRLKDWCKANNLPYTTIWGVSVSGKIPKKGLAKGWNCVKVS